MNKYVQTYFILLVFIFNTSCKGENKTELSKNNISQSESSLLSINPSESNLIDSIVTKTIIASQVPKTITRTIKQDSKGNIWFASWEGIIKYDGNSFTNITHKVSSNRFFSILEDRKGNFWFASIGGGVYYYDGKSFTNFTTKEGLPSNRVPYVYEDKNGVIWFGTEDGTSRYDGKTFTNLTTKDGLLNNDVNAIVEDKTGKFWIATRGEASFYDGKTFTKITTKEGESFTNVRSIIEDSKGNIWLGGKNGLWRYDGNSFTNLTRDFINYIYEDKKGNIWTTSETKNQGWVLSYYDKKSLSYQDETSSLLYQKASGTQIKSGEAMIFGILEDKEGNIWFGTLDGVCRYDGNTFSYFKEELKK